MAENKGMRIASFLDTSGKYKITINGANVAYLAEYNSGTTTIFFGNEHSITVGSPIEIVERDLFPDRLFGDA